MLGRTRSCLFAFAFVVLLCTTAIGEVERDDFAFIGAPGGTAIGEVERDDFAFIGAPEAGTDCCTGEDASWDCGSGMGDEEGSDVSVRPDNFGRRRVK